MGPRKTHFWIAVISALAFLLGFRPLSLTFCLWKQVVRWQEPFMLVLLLSPRLLASRLSQAWGLVKPSLCQVRSITPQASWGAWQETSTSDLPRHHLSFQWKEKRRKKETNLFNEWIWCMVVNLCFPGYLSTSSPSCKAWGWLKLMEVLCWLVILVLVCFGETPNQAFPGEFANLGVSVT